MNRAAASIATAVLLLLAAACGDGGGSEESAPPPPSSGEAEAGDTTSPEPAGVPGTTVTTDAAVDGTLLEPGDPPAPWTAVQGDEITATALAEPEVGASGISCPAGVELVPGVSIQCTAYDDEGGPFLGISRRPNEGVETNTILCQVGDGMAFAPSLEIEGRLAVAGPGAGDGEGRFFHTKAIEVGDGVHWFVLRRPGGEACPVVWDLGLGDGTTTASSSVGGATFPLADGPSCTRLAPEGLVVKPGSADGICT